MTGSDLKKWRKRNNYTQEALATALEVSRQTVITWEQQQESLAKIIELALLSLETKPERIARSKGYLLAPEG